MTTTRKQTPAQARKAALSSDYTPLYAVAGLSDVVASSLHSAWADTTEKAGQRLADWQDRSERQAKTAASDLTAFVQAFPAQVRALPETTRTRLTRWQRQAQDLARDANSAYADLAARGKRVVDDTVDTARQISGRAEQRATHVKADLIDAVDPAFEKVQETVIQARRGVTGRTASETVTPRSAHLAAVKRAEARGAAEERAAARSAAAKKAAATRAARRKAAASAAP